MVTMPTSSRIDLMMCILIIFSMHLQPSRLEDAEVKDSVATTSTASESQQLSVSTGTFQSTPSKVQEVGLAVLLPRDNRRLFSLMKATPAIEYAIEKITRLGFLSNHKLTVHLNDSQCDPTAATLAALDLYMKRQVQVFLGPVCDYSLAPIARLSPHWNIPVISPGGQASDFGDKREPQSEYPLLTRVGFNHDSLSYSLLETMDHFNWSKVELLYSPSGHENIVDKFCYLMASGFVRRLSDTTNKKCSFHLLSNATDMDDLFREAIGTKYSGRSHCRS